MRVTTIRILSFLLLACAIRGYAEAASACHQISIRIQPSIVLYINADDEIFRLFHIRGSRQCMNISQIQVSRNETKTFMTQAIFLQYILLQDSENVNWNKTGYYTIDRSDTGLYLARPGRASKGEAIVTVTDGGDGLTYSFSEKPASRALF